MNRQPASRTATLTRPVTESSPPRREQTNAGGPRRRRIGVLAIVAGLVIGGAIVLSASPDDPAVPVRAAVPGTSTAGPNADLAPDFTCQRSPLHTSCVRPVAPGSDAAVSGPNADLASDFTCQHSPLHASCATTAVPGGGAAASGPNADLAPDFTCQRSPLPASCDSALDE